MRAEREAMSYTVSIFAAEVKQKQLQGLDLDEFEHPEFDPGLLGKFLERLLRYGYVLESANALSKEYVRQAGTCPIQVAVFKTQIAFSVPFWDGCEEAIAEAVQDASELAEPDVWAVYDPQTEDWLG